MTTLTPYAEWTVTNGTLGPVLWCPTCDKQIGYLADRVPISSLIDGARWHIEHHHLDGLAQ